MDSGQEKSPPEGGTISPLPWRFETSPYNHIRCDAGCVFAADYTTDANAAFIVKSCNSHEALRTALKDLFALMDEGLLVRDISKDNEPGFAMRQLPFVQRLQRAQSALAQSE